MARNLYEILGAQPDADERELHRAWRARAAQLHPDAIRATGGSAHQQDQAEIAMRQLNAAYETLSDHQRRQAYDATLPRASHVGSTRVVSVVSVGNQPTRSSGRVWAVLVAIAAALLIVVVVSASATSSSQAAPISSPVTSDVLTMRVSNIGGTRWPAHLTN